MKQAIKKVFMNTLALMVISVVLPALAADLYVDINNQTGTNQGTKTAPFTSIQAGIDAASSGDMIHVAQGNYRENITVEDRTVSLRGGYAGSSSSHYASGGSGDFSSQDPGNITLIHGDGQNSVVSLLNAGSSEINGFTIRGGSANPAGLPYSLNGGGIYCSGGAPVISQNIIEDNNSYHPDYSDITDVHGGGIFSADADVTIRDNVIRNNQAGRGAGITVFDGSNVLIENNTIVTNNALGDHGGGLYLFGPHLVVHGNTIQGNQVGFELGWGWGGGITIINEGSTGFFSENIITDNYAPSSGSGVFVDDGATATMHHELVFANRSSECDGQVYVDGIEDSPGHFLPSHLTMEQCTIADGCGVGVFVEQHSGVVIRNSIVWNHPRESFSVAPDSQIEVNYCLSSPRASGTGNIVSDPIFVGSGDYHLRSTGGHWTGTSWMIDNQHSPAVDAGDQVTDYSLETLTNGGRVNMGVYGNTGEASRSGGDEPPIPTASNRVIPHVTRAGGGFTTRVYFENQSDTSQTYRLQPFDTNGNALKEVTGTLIAKTIMAIDSTQLLPSGTSHFFINQETEINVYVAFEAMTQPSSPAHALETCTQSRRWRFYPGDWSLVFDGIAVINRGAEPADIQIHQHSLNGQLLQTESVIHNLPPLAKSLYVVGAPTSNQFNQAGTGYFVVESNQPINLLALRGTPPSAETHYLWVNPAKPLL